MQIQSMHFKARVTDKLADQVLQDNLRKTKSKFVDKRAQAIRELPEFEATREAARAIRDRALHDLDHWLLAFEAEATRRGATVLWARDGDEVCRLVLEIAARHGCRKVVKSKSMLSEESGLNQALEAAGVAPIETDLGEYILQLNDNEPPSHIIAPVFHKSVEQVSELFARRHGTPRKTDIRALAREAREQLRPQFLSADMGISGGNFLIAETGSVALVTNEGNGRMCTTVPPVHVAITGVEKVIPTLEDFATLMRLLPRSATGQSISNYVSVLTGTRGEQESDGARHMYFILVDAGRVNLVNGEFQDILRCIRCGACMNHCPVYQTVGGHAYGWVYPGPMGSVLTPLYQGLDKALDLPNAATLCNQCGVVCPVKIPLPDLLRKLRTRQIEQKLRPWSERMAIRLWARVAAHPALYAWCAARAARLLKWLAAGRPYIDVLAAAPGWTDTRAFPAPQGKTFRELYAESAPARHGGAADRSHA